MMGRLYSWFKFIEAYLDKRLIKQALVNLKLKRKIVFIPQDIIKNTNSTTFSKFSYKKVEIFNFFIT